jgi:hypothetical protein
LRQSTVATQRNVTLLLIELTSVTPPSLSAGLVVDSILEITNCFPYPAQEDDDGSE